MAKFKKPSAEIVAVFARAIAPMPGITPRKMFGCPCAFVNGNMFAGVFQDGIFVRLSPDDRAKFARAGAQPFAPMPGRAMREYLVVPPAIVKSKTRLNAWLEKALAFAASLPPKAPKPK